MGTYLDMFFQEITGFCAFDTAGEKFFPVFFEGTVDGGWTYAQEFIPDGGVIVKSGQSWKKDICLRIRGARGFPHVYQKKAQMVRRALITSLSLTGVLLMERRCGAYLRL
jgi:hypothetical protein